MLLPRIELRFLGRPAFNLIAIQVPGMSTEIILMFSYLCKRKDLSTCLFQMINIWGFERIC
jgi:hypothetical protein